MRKNASSADNQQERLPVHLTPDYIVGLIDGEGYFSIMPDIRKYPTYKTVEIKMVFGISLKESDGEIILRALRNYFSNCGALRYRIDKRPKFCNQWEYQVRNQQDIFNVIIPFFKKNKLRLRSKKNDFEIFAQIAEIVKKKKHLTKGGFEEILKLKELMHR